MLHIYWHDMRNSTHCLMVHIDAILPQTSWLLMIGLLGTTFSERNESQYKHFRSSTRVRKCLQNDLHLFCVKHAKTRESMGRHSVFCGGKHQRHSWRPPQVEATFQPNHMLLNIQVHNMNRSQFMEYLLDLILVLKIWKCCDQLHMSLGGWNCSPVSCFIIL